MKQNLLDIFKVFSGHFQGCSSVWKYLPQHLESDHLSVKIRVNCCVQQVLLGTIFSLTLPHWDPPLAAVKQQLSSVRPLVLSAVWTPAGAGTLRQHFPFYYSHHQSPHHQAVQDHQHWVTNSPHHQQLWVENHRRLVTTLNITITDIRSPFTTPSPT